MLTVAGCDRQESKSKVASSPVNLEVSANTTLLATISDLETSTSTQGIASEHKEPSSPQAQSPEYTVLFSKLGRGVAYVAAKEGSSYVVHNGKSGTFYNGIGSVAISPDGQRVAYGALISNKWRMVDAGVEGMIVDEVGEPVFSHDGKHLAYEALIGKKWHIVVDSRMNAGCVQYYQKPVFSTDASKIFLIENTETDGLFRLVVSDLTFNRQSVKVLRAINTVTSSNRSRIATASEENGKYKLLEFSFDQPDNVKKGAPYDAISNIVFSADGASIAYVAQRDGSRFLVYNGKEERLPDGVILGSPVIRPDNRGVGVILGAKDGFFLHQAFYRDGANDRHYDNAAELVYSNIGNQHAYIAVKGQSFNIVVNGNEGPAFDKIVTPVFSPDGRLLVYRARKDGRRFVVVADLHGKTIRQHPEHEMVFDTAFTADGKSVAYGVKHGKELWWKVEKL